MQFLPHESWYSDSMQKKKKSILDSFLGVYVIFIITFCDLPGVDISKLKSDYEENLY